MPSSPLRSKLLLRASFENLKRKTRQAAQKKPASLLEEIRRANLRGRAGRFFPVAKKWELALMQNRPCYLIVNGGAGGMGNLKNHFFLSQLAKPLLAGVKIAQAALQPKKTFFFLSRHYHPYLAALQQAAQELECPITWHLSSYHPLNGEETSCIQELEGKFPQPRKKPPYPAVKGYFFQPTIVQSLEVFLHLAFAYTHGWEKWAAFGESTCPGTFVLSLTGEGPVGVAEIAFGEPLGVLYEKAPEKPSFLLITGGESSVFLPYSENLSFSLQEDFQPGLGNVIAVSSKTSLLRLAYTLARVQETASCGKCATCKMGHHNLAYRLRRIFEGGDLKEEMEIISGIVSFLPQHGDCSFLDSSAAIFQALLQYEDFSPDRKRLSK